MAGSVQRGTVAETSRQNWRSFRAVACIIISRRAGKWCRHGSDTSRPTSGCGRWGNQVVANIGAIG
jgi:hypothetical protein